MSVYKSLSRRTQEGATLLVGMIMLIVITLLLTSAYTLSNTNLKSVGNMQFRQEAIQAANTAIQLVISSDPFTSPISQTIGVDINNDGTDDYSVAVAVPTCLKGVSTGSTAPGSSVGIEKWAGTGGTSIDTLWDIKATVTDTASSTSVVVHQGVTWVDTNTTHATTYCG